MDPQYLQMLMEMLQQQQGGMGDPYAPSGGFPAPAMPNGKMPQYRTQGSGFVSDGTVRDYAGMAMADQDRFSTDALLDVDPQLKPLIARAVAEAGQDPYAAYANFDEGPYRQALVNMALQQVGGHTKSFDPSGLEGADADGDGKMDEGFQWTNDDAIAAIIANNAGAAPGANGNPNVATEGDFFDPLSGRNFQKVDTYENVLRSKMGAYQGALDNFFTQAAPSTERNLNDIAAVTGALGGMPFPSRGGSDSVDYSQAGPGFGGGAPPRDPGIRASDGAYSKHQYMHDYTMAMQGDQRARALAEVLAHVQRNAAPGRRTPTRAVGQRSSNSNLVSNGAPNRRDPRYRG